MDRTMTTELQLFVRVLVSGQNGPSVKSKHSAGAPTSLRPKRHQHAPIWMDRGLASTFVGEETVGEEREVVNNKCPIPHSFDLITTLDVVQPLPYFTAVTR